EITNVPPGFLVSTPLVIQSGHSEVKGTINAAPDAMQPAKTNSPEIQVVASAVVKNQPVIKEVNTLGKIKLAEKPKLFVAIEPYSELATNFVERSVTSPPLEITIAPGQSIPAW